MALQVVIPVQFPDKPPMSVSLLGLRKTDMQLLAIAASLAPKIQQAAIQLHQESLQAAEQGSADSTQQSSGSNAAGEASHGYGLDCRGSADVTGVTADSSQLSPTQSSC